MTSSLRFTAIVDPPSSVINALSALAPENPFVTSQYLSAQTALGIRAVAFVLEGVNDPLTGCLGYFRGGWRSRMLDIPSLANLDDPSATTLFWDGLTRFCRQSGVTQLSVQTYATRVAHIPSLPNERTHRQRQEYVLDLGEASISCSANHRRNAARARKAGVTMRRTDSSDGVKDHLRLMHASMDRREQRGEHVPTTFDAILPLALLSHGAAELFQAIFNDDVVSSLLVLRAPEGAYYQSAGTSPEGMDCGASQFLITSVAEALQADGLRVFNLGGAGPESPGLERFKLGFGARAVPLDTVVADVRAPVIRRFQCAVSAIVRRVGSYRSLCNI